MGGGDHRLQCWMFWWSGGDDWETDGQSLQRLSHGHDDANSLRSLALRAGPETRSTLSSKRASRRCSPAHATAKCLAWAPTSLSKLGPFPQPLGHHDHDRSAHRTCLHRINRAHADIGARMACMLT
eukprot:2850448-Rhodomonas_salina.2